VSKYKRRNFHSGSKERKEIEGGVPRLENRKKGKKPLAREKKPSLLYSASSKKRRIRAQEEERGKRKGRF